MQIEKREWVKVRVHADGEPDKCTPKRSEKSNINVHLETVQTGEAIGTELFASVKNEIKQKGFNNKLKNLLRVQRFRLLRSSKKLAKLSLKYSMYKPHTQTYFLMACCSFTCPSALSGDCSMTL